MRVFVVLGFLLMGITSFPQATIVLVANTDNAPEINVYFPLGEFTNREIPKTIAVAGKYTEIALSDIKSPIFIQVGINKRWINVLVEPGSRIEIALNQDGNIAFDGPNERGHDYFNNSYNRILGQKYAQLSQIFDDSGADPTATLIASLDNQIENQLRWIDSLFRLGAATVAFKEYMTLDARYTLVSHVANLCDKYLKRHSFEGKEKSDRIKDYFFNQFDPLNQKIKRCLAAQGMYYAYYDHKFSGEKIDNPNEVFVDDTPYFSFAPNELKEFVWGNSLTAHVKLNPNYKKVCQYIQRYKHQFPLSPFNEFFDDADLCRERKKSETLILQQLNSDLFVFANFYFPNKRVLIDLWATWCLPCIAEFKHYTEQLYKSLSENDVELLFLSLDSPKNETRWRKEVEEIGPKGKHSLADPVLSESITQVIFDGGPIVIPRYILIDEFGKFISVDFTRPSDPKFSENLMMRFSK